MTEILARQGKHNFARMDVLIWCNVLLALDNEEEAVQRA
jgi:hypothetical protein